MAEYTTKTLVFVDAVQLVNPLYSQKTSLRGEPGDYLVTFREGHLVTQHVLIQDVFDRIFELEKRERSSDEES